LTAPAFFTSQAGNPLTPAEQSEWTAFLAQHPPVSAAAQSHETSGAEPLVRVKTPASTAGGLLVVNVRIEHK